jgi:hypothetical protein
MSYTDYHVVAAIQYLTHVQRTNMLIMLYTAITYDYYSNELKAAKRRIYRQREKIEQQRQILRYILIFSKQYSSCCCCTVQ